MDSFTMTGLHVFTVDTFTDIRFTGNPTTVCLDTDSKPLAVCAMQKTAREMNLSGTAFVRPLRAGVGLDSGNRFGLRWFSPVTEFKMCGHGTLATAFILFDRLNNPSREITFETLSGELRVRNDNGFLEMDFPTGFTQPEDMDDHEPLLRDMDDHEPLLRALVDDPAAVGELVFCKSGKYLLVRLQDGWSREQFENWCPDLESLTTTDKTGKVCMVIVTLRGPPEKGFVNEEGKPYDFVSRTFAPWTGVPEDPVTGSSHTVLAHYWSERLDKTDFYAHQCSRRGGDVWVKITGERTILKGQAVLTMAGRLLL